MESPSFFFTAKYIPYKGEFAAQTDDNSVEKQKGREENEEPGGKKGCEGHGSHHGS